MFGLVGGEAGGMMPGAPFIPTADANRFTGHDPFRSPAGGMTIYDLLRHFCEAARWSSVEEMRDAQALVDQLEAIALFGDMADNFRSPRRDTNV